MSSIKDALRVIAIEKRLEELHALVNQLAERSAVIDAKLDALEGRQQEQQPDPRLTIRRMEQPNRKGF